MPVNQYFKTLRITFRAGKLSIVCHLPSKLAFNIYKLISEASVHHANWDSFIKKQTLH